MKSFKKIAIILLAMVLATALFACGSKPKNPNTPTTPPDELTPKEIKLTLQAITDYSSQAQYWDPASVVYQDTTNQEKKLTARIDQKKKDCEEDKKNNKEVSSIVKIFANSQANELIDAMSKAALPTGKMEKTVDYLAGSKDVTIDEIDAIVADLMNSKKLDRSITNGWSFFDDYELYDRLQKQVDKMPVDNDADQLAKDKAGDNVKRQYRNMAYKIFEGIGMDGAEFGRFATQQLLYATVVVNRMSTTTINLDPVYDTPFNNYCRKELDYETLVYLRAFNVMYAGGLSYSPEEHNGGKKECVKLYGYYYVYGYNDYKSQSDEEFEKQLEYSHKEVFDDNQEWLNYVKMQRSNYIKAYRYPTEFFQVFYSSHFGFQQLVEKEEQVVYDIEAKWNGLSYTAEMVKAIDSGNNYSGLKGQLNFTDWLYCYSADETAMTNYNEADKLKYYAEKNNQGIEKQKEGEFKVNMEQLKMVDYLLLKMSNTDLGNTLWFQVYSYSGEVAKTGQQYRKNQVLVKAQKKDPDEVVAIEVGLTGADAISFANGKLDVLQNQLKAGYENADGKASSAKTQDWRGIEKNVKDTIDADYSSCKNNADRVKKMEQLLIKKTYKNCGAVVGESDKCSKNPGGHINEDGSKEEQVYDTTHKVSLFLNDYQKILRYMAGQSTVTFNGQAASTANADNAYKIMEFNNLPQTWTVGFKGNLYLDTTKKDKKPVFIETKSMTVKAGETLLSTKNESDDRKWWNDNGTDSNGSCPKRPNWTVTENYSQYNANGQFTYSYEFVGWFLDEKCQYQFFAGDTISFDLQLYAGYNIKKEKGSK